MYYIKWFNCSNLFDVFISCFSVHYSFYLLYPFNHLMTWSGRWPPRAFNLLNLFNLRKINWNHGNKYIKWFYSFYFSLLFNLFDFTKNARLWPPGAFQCFNSFNVTRKKTKFKKHQCIKKQNVIFRLIYVFVFLKSIYLTLIYIFLRNLLYLLKWSDFGLLGHLTGKKNQVNTKNEKNISFFNLFYYGIYFLCLT